MQLNYQKKFMYVYTLLSDYMRTGSAFGIISLLVMFLGHLFAVYTLKRPRYVIKRLTALMHFMTGKYDVMCVDVHVQELWHA